MKPQVTDSRKLSHMARPNVGQEDEQTNYLLDSHALEKCFAEGSAEDHQLLIDQHRCLIHVTSDTKSDFLDAFPGDKEKVSDVCALARQRTEDIKLSAVFADRLHNLPDIEEPEVQNKLLLIAVARRLNATLVSGEGSNLLNSLPFLAAHLDVTCVSVEKFLASIA